MIEKLLQFFDIDDEMRGQGRELWSFLAPHADPIIDAFYQNIHAAEIEPRISDAAVERLKAKQKAHWAELFGSQFDGDYARSVHRIGIRHRDIQLSTAWYVAGYMALKIEFMNVIVLSNLPAIEKGRLLRVLEKYVAIDMTLALSTYDNNTIVLD
jgi:hypothetical protein